jgi:threonine-phosphate decarboxylase
MKKSSHGGDIYSFARKLKISPDKVIDFSSNINQLSPKVKIDLKKVNFSRYPDRNYRKLKKALAKKYLVKPNQIALFHGASSAIETLIRDKEITIYAPAYSEYKIYAKNVKLINRFKNLYEKPTQNSLVIFVNPSTPDGKYYDLEELFEIWKEQNNTILIDESFLDFTPNTSDFEKNNKLYIIKSLTKFYSSAGVRIGLVISSEKNIKKLEATIPPWSISTFDEAYILKALKDKNFEKETLKKITKDKKRLYKVLKTSKYIKKIYESNANFFLVKLKKIKADRLQKKCAKKNILIKESKNFDFLDNSYARFAVCSKKDIKKLKKVLC